MSAPANTPNFIANVLQTLSNNFFADLGNTNSTITPTLNILSNEIVPNISPPTPTLHPLSYPSLVASFNNFDNSSMSMRSERGNMTIRRMVSPPTTDPAQNNTPLPPPTVAIPIVPPGGAHPPPPAHLMGGATINAPFTPDSLPCIQFTTNLSNSYSTIVSTRNSRTIETRSCGASTQPNTSVEYIFYTKHTQPQFTYFEVKLADKLFSNAQSTAPEVALGFASFGYKGMVGWMKNSIGFHVDNGRVYDERDATNGIADRVYLGSVSRGDVIGCLLNHKNGEFLVVKNGQELHNLSHGTVFKHEHFKQSHQFLPTISCSDIHLEMEVNLGLDMVRKPFLYPRVVHFRQLERLLAMVVSEDQISSSTSFNFTDLEITTQTNFVQFE